MSGKILISPTSFGKCGLNPLDALKAKGFEPVLNTLGRKMQPQEVIELAKDAVGIVAGVEIYDKATLKELKSLKCISRCGVGMDSIDLKATKDLGIAVKNTPLGPTRAVAELTIGAILDCLRGISYCDRHIRKNNWQKFMGNLLLSKTVGIVGYGQIGQLVAKLLLPFGVEVIATDPAIDQSKSLENIQVVPFEQLLMQSDIICLHVSFAKDNSNLLGEQEIKQMKRGAILINMSRGGIVDEDALYSALKSGHLAAAAIDVFEKEPYSGKLAELDNCVLTSHIGSYAKEARLQMEIDAVNNLIEELER